MCARQRLYVCNLDGFDQVVNRNHARDDIKGVVLIRQRRINVEILILVATNTASEPGVA